MLFLIELGCFAFVMVCAAGVVEAWARHRHWPGYDDRQVRYEPRHTNGRPW